MTRAAHWLKGNPWSVGYAILALGVVVSLAIDRAQTAASDRRDLERVTEQAEARIDLAEHDARNNCIQGNESRRLIRTIGVNLSVANAEALIQIAGESADAATVQAFRDATRVNAEQTVSVLGDRNCQVEAMEARQQAAEIEGIEP